MPKTPLNINLKCGTCGIFHKLSAGYQHCYVCRGDSKRDIGNRL